MAIESMTLSTQGRRPVTIDADRIGEVFDRAGLRIRMMSGNRGGVDRSAELETISRDVIDRLLSAQESAGAADWESAAKSLAVAKKRLGAAVDLTALMFAECLEHTPGAQMELDLDDDDET